MNNHLQSHEHQAETLFERNQRNTKHGLEDLVQYGKWQVGSAVTVYDNIKPLKPTSYIIPGLASITLIRRCYLFWSLTYWGQTTHICVSILTSKIEGIKTTSMESIVSDNGLSPGWRHLSRPQCVKPLNKHPILPHTMVHGYCTIADDKLIYTSIIHNSHIFRTKLIISASYSRQLEIIIGYWRWILNKHPWQNAKVYIFHDTIYD